MAYQGNLSTMSIEQREQFIQMWLDGETKVKIGKTFGVTPAAVAKYIERDIRPELAKVYFDLRSSKSRISLEKKISKLEDSVELLERLVKRIDKLLGPEGSIPDVKLIAVLVSLIQQLRGSIMDAAKLAGELKDLVQIDVSLDVQIEQVIKVIDDACKDYPEARKAIVDELKRMVA